MEILFTFLAERYERKSVVLITNPVFSEKNRIFKDPITTLVAMFVSRITRSFST